MIAVIRISGLVNVDADIKEAFNRLRLRRKYSLILLNPSEDNKKLLIKLRNKIAYGNINPETLVSLIEKRGQSIKKGQKIDAEKVISQLGKKNLEELGLKPFFRLHPPRKGIEAKKHFGVGKGVLGDNREKINDLIARML